MARALVAWAGARGVRIADAPGPGDVLVVERAIGGEERAFRAGRDGWSASGRGRAVRLDRGAHPGLEPWLEADGVPLVAAGPGRVVVGWEPGEPSDAAAFAVSWARLLDESALAPDGIVPLEERLAAGPSGSAPPAPADLARRAPWTWALSALAAGLALVALLARRA